MMAATENVIEPGHWRNGVKITDEQGDDVLFTLLDGDLIVTATSADEDNKVDVQIGPQGIDALLDILPYGDIEAALIRRQEALTTPDPTMSDDTP